MPAEPDGYDLQRQIDRLRDDLKAALDRAESHVTETGLTALLHRVYDQINALGEDIAQERAFRAADILAERDARKAETVRLETQMQRMVTTQRWVATAVLLPIALFVANLVFLFGRS
jgi:cob(I)alamin adenosyltransferase